MIADASADSLYLEIRYVGEAYLSLDHPRPPQGTRWLSARTLKDDATGALAGFEVQAGRVFLTVDRPRLPLTGTTKDPLIWCGAAWAIFGAPVMIAATGLAWALGAVFRAVFRAVVAKPMGWVRRTMQARRAALGEM